MKRILSVAMAAAFAGAMPPVHAQSIPTMEACAQYAEADAAYNTAEQEYIAAHTSPLQIDDWDDETAVKAAYKRERERKEAASAALWAALDALNAARPADAAIDAAIDEALTVLPETYLAVLTEGGGMQSDVWDGSD